MKYTKILRIFSIVFILSLLAAAIPATPAQAARSVTLTPAEGSIGDTITITGTDFNKSTEGSDKYANIYFSSDEATTLHDIDDEVTHYKLLREGKWLDENGDFETTFTVPSKLDDGASTVDVTSGTYYVYVTHYPYTRIAAVAATFTVTGGEITIDPASGPVDTEVDITGADFSANKDIIIEYDGTEIDIEIGDTQTDSNGDFASTILIPEDIAGAHTITVTVSGSEVEAEFTMESEITLSPTSGEANSEVTVTGTGFGRRKDVVVYFNNVGLATITTGSQGGFNTTFDVPDLGAGIYDVETEDEDANIDKAKFTITVPSPPSPPSPTPPPPAPTPPPSPTAASINPASGNIGTYLLISGTGFEALGAITVRYDGEEMATATADASGLFVAAFTVPAGKYGDHTIIISDGTNTHQLAFTIESTPPPVPAPLLPAMGVKVKLPASFDWDDVIDDSLPLTYVLQVATSDDFAAASVVLEKKGLTKSEYTITEEEKLKMVGQEDPYYWRVRAVDGASNEGDWTGAGAFYVAATFAMPSWALYTLIGLGGIFLFAIGYWLGRRTAYYY